MIPLHDFYHTTPRFTSRTETFNPMSGIIRWMIRWWYGQCHVMIYFITYIWLEIILWQNIWQMYYYIANIYWGNRRDRGRYRFAPKIHSFASQLFEPILLLRHLFVQTMGIICANKIDIHLRHCYTFIVLL